jgi:hypothetical protein
MLPERSSTISMSGVARAPLTTCASQPTPPPDGVLAPLVVVPLAVAPGTGFCPEDGVRPGALCPASENEPVPTLVAVRRARAQHHAQARP